MRLSMSFFSSHFFPGAANFVPTTDLNLWRSQDCWKRLTGSAQKKKLFPSRKRMKIQHFFLLLPHVWAGPELSLIKICSVNRNPPTIPDKHTYTHTRVTHVPESGFDVHERAHCVTVTLAPWHEKFRGLLSSATRHGFRARRNRFYFFFFRFSELLSTQRK